MKAQYVAGKACDYYVACNRKDDNPEYLDIAVRRWRPTDSLIDVEKFYSGRFLTKHIYDLKSDELEHVIVKCLIEDNVKYEIIRDSMTEIRIRLNQMIQDELRVELEIETRIQDILAACMYTQVEATVNHHLMSIMNDREIGVNSVAILFYQLWLNSEHRDDLERMFEEMTSTNFRDYINATHGQLGVLLNRGTEDGKTVHD